MDELNLKKWENVTAQEHKPIIWMRDSRCFVYLGEHQHDLKGRVTWGNILQLSGYEAQWFVYGQIAISLPRTLTFLWTLTPVSSLLSVRVWFCTESSNCHFSLDNRTAAEKHNMLPQIETDFKACFTSPLSPRRQRSQHYTWSSSQTAASGSRAPPPPRSACRMSKV